MKSTKHACLGTVEVSETSSLLLGKKKVDEKQKMPDALAQTAGQRPRRVMNF